MTSHGTKIVRSLSICAERNAEERMSCHFPTAFSDPADASLCRAIALFMSLKLDLEQNTTIELIRSLLLSPCFATALLPAFKHKPSSLLMTSVRVFLEHHGFSSPCQLVEHHFDAIFSLLPKPEPCYSPCSVSWVLLRALVHICPRAVASNFDVTVAQFLMAHTHPASNTLSEDRINALSLVHALVLSPTSQEILTQTGFVKIIEGAVLPNLIWSAGRTASSIRKASLAVLHGLLHGQKLVALRDVLLPRCKQVLFELLPALRTAVEEYDTSAREISLSCLTAIFDSLPRASLEHKEFCELYPVIIKRLDDSFDDIRLEACATFIAFVRFVNTNSLEGSALEYCIEHLLIHLDDSNLNIQNAVFHVLKVLENCNNSAKLILANKVREVRSSYRDSSFIHRLLVDED